MITNLLKGTTNVSNSINNLKQYAEQKKIDVEE